MTNAINNGDYDLSYIKELGEGNSFVLMLINLFLSSSKEDLELFDEAFENEDWADAGSLAHKMRSRTQHFKMGKLAKMLKEIEDRCTQRLFKEDFKELALMMKIYYFEIIDLLTQESVNLNQSKG